MKTQPLTHCYPSAACRIWFGTALRSLVWFGLLAACALANAQFIEPGGVWLDNRGAQIQAHGGGVIKVGDAWYWFGEDRTQTNDPNKRYVACYSSTNLLNWTFRNQVLQLSDPESLGSGWVLERPKVYYNTNTLKYVMYMHLDNSNYSLAHVATAACDTADGNYAFQRSFRPLGQQSRDIGQFIDDDGSAYLLFESRPTGGFYVAQLTSDYLDVTQTCFIQKPLEGLALVHYNGLYYVVGSQLTGWAANPNKFATATNLSGPWSAFNDIAPTNANTYGSQSSMLLKVAGTNTTTVVFMGDIWKPSTLWDSRYLWMPLEIGGGNLFLPQPQSWTLNVGSGMATNALAAVPGTFVKLSGGIIGTPGSYANMGETITNVFDGDLTTFFDGPNSSGGSNCWVGLDFGPGIARLVGEVKYCPRTGYPGRMVGGQFQGANTADFSDATTLFTVSIQPATNVMTTQVAASLTPFRYVRYLSPAGGWGNVAEVEFDMLQPQLECGLQGNQFHVTWPSSPAGWWLQVRTNLPGTGLAKNWATISNSISTNQVFWPVGAANDCVFFRLIYP
jgi:hypothetical protein